MNITYQSQSTDFSSKRIIGIGSTKTPCYSCIKKLAAPHNLMFGNNLNLFLHFAVKKPNPFAALRWILSAAESARSLAVFHGGGIALHPDH